MLSVRLAAASRPSSSAHSEASASSEVGRLRAWSRSSSIVAAWLRITGTDGRNTDAVSPRRRARTNRPTACAKNSGVEVDVA